MTGLAGTPSLSEPHGGTLGNDESTCRATGRPATPGPACHDDGMLVESVPNYSEGRRSGVVDQLADAIRTTPGAYLLDRTSDASHNRSVLTLAGEARAVEAALEASIKVG